MITEVRSLVDEYAQWLRGRIELKHVGEWIEVTTPYLDRHNDYLQIYVKSDRDKGLVKMTDDGYTITDLRHTGLEFDTPKRKELLLMTVQGFGVRTEGDALVVDATPSNFPLKKHNLVQAMLAVNDLFYLTSQSVMSLFAEDVAKWLDQADIRFTPRVKLTGRSGYDHMFDFVVPASRNASERLLKVINRPNKEKAQSAAFAFIDTRNTRPVNSDAFVLLNDTDAAVSPAIIAALSQYEITAVRWSEREQALPALTR